MITQTYYIQTGKKNAMYTLRCHRDNDQFQGSVLFDPDFYLCNLAADEETASYKATLYVNVMRERMPDRKDFRIFFDADAGGKYQRRGKLSVSDTRALERIEAGFVPFGKHAGKAIADLDMGYLLWLSDKAGTFEGVPMNAMGMNAQGIALERGYIAIREAKREERANEDALSGHLGTIGERREFEGEIVTSFAKRYDDQAHSEIAYWINKVRCGTDLVTWIGGKSIGAMGSVVKFKATIVGHDDYKGVKSTKVNRPKVIEAATA